MTQFILGMLGALLALLLIGTGAFLGVKVSGRLRATTKPETPEEAERRRLIEDQRAFEAQMRYNADVAYGIAAAADLLGRGEGDG